MASASSSAAPAVGSEPMAPESGCGCERSWRATWALVRCTWGCGERNREMRQRCIASGLLQSAPRFTRTILDSSCTGSDCDPSIKLQIAGMTSSGSLTTSCLYFLPQLMREEISCSARRRSS